MDYFSGPTSLEIHQRILDKTCKIKTLNVGNLKIESSLYQWSTTSSGQEKEMIEFVFRTQNKSRKTRRDSREDIGHPSGVETKRNGIELSVTTRLKENEIPLLHRTIQRNWSSSI